MFLLVGGVGVIEVGGWGCNGPKYSQHHNFAEYMRTCEICRIYENL